MYRSKKCTRTRTKGNGDSYTVPGFNAEKYPLTRVSPGVFSADIPAEGGGSCDWQLSNIKLEVKLKNPQVVDSIITDNFGFEVVFITDNNAPQVFNGGYIPHKGDFNESLLLFPLARESFLDGYKKTFSLIGSDRMLTYRLSGAENVHITINYERDMISYWTGVKEKKPGNKTSLKYPNGEIEYNSEIYPDYKKLVEMRDAMQKK
ncbi:MAG: hypothetical protein RR510_16700 [Morganella sp. (in: enterobacteria)]